jgi:hypothetical protein
MTGRGKPATTSCRRSTQSLQLTGVAEEVKRGSDAYLLEV